MLAPFPGAELQGAQQLRHLVQLLQMICTFSIMAIHSFCHLEEPLPQNNDLKKVHLFARKSLHLGISSDAAQGCFLKSGDSLTGNGFGVPTSSQINDNLGKKPNSQMLLISFWHRDKIGVLSKNRGLYTKHKKVLDIQWDENLKTDYWGLPSYRSAGIGRCSFKQPSKVQVVWKYYCAAELKEFCWITACLLLSLASCRNHFGRCGLLVRNPFQSLSAKEARY